MRAQNLNSNGLTYSEEGNGEWKSTESPVDTSLPRSECKNEGKVTEGKMRV